MRKEVPEIGWGDFAIIGARDPAILIMRYDWRNNSVLFVHNLDEKPREISFASGVPGDAGKLLINLLSEDHSRAAGGRHRLLIEGYGYRWYRVGGLDYLLKRREIDNNETGVWGNRDSIASLPMVNMRNSRAFGWAVHPLVSLARSLRP